MFNKLSKYYKKLLSSKFNEKIQNNIEISNTKK